MFVGLSPRMQDEVILRTEHESAWGLQDKDAERTGGRLARC